MKLKDCPFCGKEAYYRKNTTHDGEELHSIGCSDPYCPVKPIVQRFDKENAIERWNTRVV